MAGIGLELKKIYKKNDLSNLAAGAAYSSMVTVGPTILIIGVLFVIYTILGYNVVSIADRELLSTILLYIFVFSGILVSPFSALFSRYIADKIFQNKYEDIIPSYYTGLFVVGGIASLVAVPVLYSLVVNANLDAPYVLSAYILWMSMIIVYFSTIYLHATKNYRIVFFTYVIGLVVALILSYVFNNFFDVVHSIVYALAIGFFIIAFTQFAQVKRSFYTSSDNYTECLRYLGRFKNIFISNALYSVATYSHMLVFWFSGDRIVASTFYIDPMYDMAACIAMFSNLSATIIFIVMAETQFHDDYQNYVSSIISGTYRTIQDYKKAMFRTLSRQLFRLIVIQTMITTIMFLLAAIFLPQLYFSSMVLDIYPILAISYFILYVVYAIIIYLYYFNDQTGCLILSAIFLVVSTVGSLISKELSIELYGLGFFIGCFSAFTFGFFRIKYIEKNIDKHVFCGDVVVKPTRVAKSDHVIYRNN